MGGLFFRIPCTAAESRKYIRASELRQAIRVLCIADHTHRNENDYFKRNSEKYYCIQHCNALSIMLLDQQPRFNLIAIYYK